MGRKRKNIILVVMVLQMLCRNFLKLSLLIRQRMRYLDKPRQFNRPAAATYTMIGRLNAQLNHLHRTIEVGYVQCVVNLRMNRNEFGRLCFLLINVGGLVDLRYVWVEKKVAMFLSILAHHKKNCVIGHDYIRSGQTISAHFHEVMRALVKLHPLLLVKPVPVEETCTDENWKWFKGCLGALYGTHISVHVPARYRTRYKTRKGTIAVNVMDVCDLNMNFVYALTSWEGSTADASVLRDALNRDNSFMVPRG
ncbi:uncharacterized protein [Henckelia pumila]|uniref:uncharacterized protein n=1 Tax=Henckelia pumila TaxID=405737 RepID=UPI003C6E9309